MIQRAGLDTYEYGVWWAGFTFNRLPVLIAVDAFGDIRKWRAVKPLEDGEEIGERMWAWLRTHHPHRKLALVEETTEEPRQQGPGRLVPFRGRMVDERILNDPRSPLYAAHRRDQLIKAGAARRSIFTSSIG